MQNPPIYPHETTLNNNTAPYHKNGLFLLERVKSLELFRNSNLNASCAERS